MNYANYKNLVQFTLVILMTPLLSPAESPQCQLTLQSVKNFRSYPAPRVHLTNWVQNIFNHRGFNKAFTETSNSGFIVSEIEVTFNRDFAVLDSTQLETHQIMETLFPNMTFTPCESGGCRVTQSIGGFISRLDYTLDYRYLKINSEAEAQAVGLSVDQFKNNHYPKYIMAQLGSDWSKFFNRTVAVTIFEGDPEDSHQIHATAVQALNLTMVGSMGKGTIETVLREQVVEFVDLFEQWALTQSQVSN